MAQKSEIEWTDATWNPVTGCTKIGPGCDNCYAEKFAERWRGRSTVELLFGGVGGERLQLPHALWYSPS